MTEALLAVDSVSFAYDDAPVLRHISFQVPSGQYVGLIGPNGSGKTTLFNIISGYYPAQSGAVAYAGTDIRKIPVHRRAARIALVPQRQRLDFPFTCLEMVLLGLHPHRARFEPITAAHLDQARGVMQATEIWQFAGKPVTELSGGELQRVILARALMQQPRLLLLDEAMSELDIAGRIAMLKLLRTMIAQTGMTVIGIHHDLASAYRYADRVIALANGALAADGTPEQVFTRDFFREVFFVDAEILHGRGFLINDNINTSNERGGKEHEKQTAENHSHSGLGPDALLEPGRLRRT